MLKKTLLVMGVVLALGFVWPVHGVLCEEGRKEPWQGKLADGTVITEKRLNKILEEYRAVPDQERVSGKKLIVLRGAEISGAKLSGADLDRADLTETILSGADLRGAKLRHAILIKVDLCGANLDSADFSHAYMERASLTEAKCLGTIFEDATLRHAKLEEAELYLANLKKARLEFADLSGADLRLVDLENARLNFAIIRDALFEPGPCKLPSVHTFAEAVGIWQTYWCSNPVGLNKLKKGFEDEGYTRQTRETRHSLKHNNYHLTPMDDGPSVEKWKPAIINWDSYISYWLLEKPTGWGESPMKPLVLLVISMAPFAVLYMIALGNSHSSGIFLGRLTSSYVCKPGRMLHRLLYALYCSIQMGLRVTWKDPSKGTWITHMQPTDLVFAPKRWWRMVVGLQTVIGSYLIALFLATYFGGLFKD